MTLYETYLEFVKQDGEAIRYIPEQFLSEEICVAAVKQTYLAFWKFPKEFLSEEICVAAVKQHGTIIKYVPLHLRTEDVCIAAVKQNGKILHLVPRDILSEKICIEAVKQTSQALKYVPMEFQLEIIKQLAVAKKLENGTECLIMGDVIGVGDCYKMCSTKRDHVISFESWIKIGDDKKCNYCCYCKGELLEPIFQNN